MRLNVTLFIAVVCFLTLPACQQQLRLRTATSSEITRLSGKIYFETARSDLSAISKQEIARKAVSLKRHPNVTIILEGHADERGPEEMNLILGDRRARQAKWQFVHEGVAPKRIVVVSYGESRPADPSHNEQAYRTNRRVEIVVR